MKKRILSLLVVMVMMCSFVPIIARADTSGNCGDNLTWNIKNDTLTISGTGNMKGYSSIASFPWFNNKSSFTKVIIEEGVTSISYGAFSLYDNIVSVEIPSTMVEIPSASIHGDNLETINVNQNNMYYSSINGVLFNKDQTILLAYAGKSTTTYSIPSSVNVIDDYAFYYSKGVKNIIIPNSVESIGKSAFCRSELTNISIPNSVKTIESYAFDDCDNLLYATIGDGVNVIPEHLFYGCDSLKRVTMGKNITSINNNGFNLCSSLTDIEVNSLNSTFSSNDGVLFNNNKTKLILCPNGKSGVYVIPNSVVDIESHAFTYCQKISNIILPDSVKTIGYEAFFDCSLLSSITIGKGVTRIEKNAFSFCTNLNSVTIPNHVSIIGEEAFSHCSELTNITISNSVSSIGFAAFYSCPNLANVYYNGSNDEWNNMTIEDMNTCLTNATIHYNSAEGDTPSPNPSTEKHDITIEVRDAKTNNLIPNSRISVFSNADKAKFYTLANGKTTLKDVDFPIYSIGAYADDYTYNRAYENVQYPENGKIVFSLTSFESQKVEVKGVYIFNKIDSMNVGETHQLEAYVSPITATDKGITWSSSDTSVATVNNGTITGIGEGTAIITAKTSNNKTAKCTVNVIDNLNYNKYGYSFTNYYDNFGYSYEYQIPKERYLQAGFSLPIATLKYKSNEKWEGSCAGMSFSSILFYKDTLKEYKYDKTAKFPIDFNAPNADDKQSKKLREMIELFQVAQSRPQVKYSDFSAADIARELDNGNPVALSLKTGKNDAVGHAVVIYSYTKSGNTYTFNIYDCSRFVTELTYTTDSNYSFDGFYTDSDGNRYKWKIKEYCTSSSLISLYWALFYQNNNGAISLLSVDDKNSYMYIIRDAENIKITNSAGQTSTVVNGEVSGEIEELRLVNDNNLSEHSQYILIAPIDTYTVVGETDKEATTTFSDDNMSVSVTSTSSTPITISNNLYDVNIASKSESNYNITYTTYDNIFDEMNISGMSYSGLQTSLNGNDITISGAKSIIADATRSGILTEVSADIEENQTAVVECSKSGEGNTVLQITANQSALTETALLPERLQAPMPEYDLESGEYTEGQTLTFTKDDNTIIYYTTDGSKPTTESMIYTTPIEINKSATINVFASKYGYENSDIITLEYTLPDVIIPIPSLLEGEYNGMQQVELYADEDTNIYYTTDGSDPIENGELYTCPIPIIDDTTIIAYAEKNGCKSKTVNYNYNISQIPKAELSTPILEDVTYGTKLSDIVLPQNWAWSDGNIVPTVENSGYEAIYTVTDYSNYDWSGIDGYNADTHTVTRTIPLTVNKSNSEVSAANTEITYSEQLILTANVSKIPTAQNMSLFSTAEDKVEFFAGKTLLGTADVAYTDSSKTSGTAEITIDTNDRQLKIGNNTITAVYGGSVNLNGSENNNIIVKLNKKAEVVPELTIDFENEALTGLDDNAKYIIDNVDADVQNCKIALGNSQLGTTLSIVRKAHDEYYSDSAAQSLEIPARPDKPTIVEAIQPDVIGGTGTIKGITETMEYSTDNGATWNDGNGSDITNIVGSTTYLVRYKATTNKFKSDNYSITIDIFGAEKEPTPSVDINYADEILTGFESGTYAINGTVVTVENGVLNIDESYYGKHVSIVKKGDGTTTNDSDAQEFTIPDRPSTPNVVASAVTAVDKNDGKITGTTSDMEYRISGGKWTNCTGSEIINLAAGTYEVRVKATDRNFSGSMTQVIVDTECVKITAIYTADGVLEDIKVATINISEITTHQNTETNKTFYWESLESMKPIDLN